MPNIVQAQIKHKGKQYMAEIQKYKRASKKFAEITAEEITKLKKLQPSTFLIHKEKKHLEGEHARPHIHRLIRKKFRELDVWKPEPKSSAQQKTA